jgi:hypothetical protein
MSTITFEELGITCLSGQEEIYSNSILEFRYGWACDAFLYIKPRPTLENCFALVTSRGVYAMHCINAEQVEASREYFQTLKPALIVREYIDACRTIIRDFLTLAHPGSEKEELCFLLNNR